MTKSDTDLTRRKMLKTSAILSTAAGAGLNLSFTAGATDIPQGVKVAEGEKYKSLGAPRPRAEGSLKVTGAAHYSAEMPVEGVLYGVVIQSTISNGHISHVDTSVAEKAEGVIAVYTHENSLKLNPVKLIKDGGAAITSYLPLQDNVVLHNGQNIGLVVAETFEQATWAASQVKFDYEVQTPVILMTDGNAAGREKEAKKIEFGEAAQFLENAPVRLKETYSTPREYPMPMELHGCIAQWKGNALTVWEPSQWVAGAQTSISEWMGIDREQVTIVSPYVGGGFGSKPVPYTHVALACAASRELKRPVKVILTRPQTFTGLGGRPATQQTLELGADRNGKVSAIVHHSISDTSIKDTYVETCNKVTAMMYGVPNVFSIHSVIPVNTVTPGWMRAPGENPSAFALEVAMDELAAKLNLDPIELRLRNWADHDYEAKLPWTSRKLREAYSEGAKAFGWEKRNPEPRSMREGHELIGWGMAAGTYPVLRLGAEARIILDRQGHFTVQSAGADIGTGTYTILAQAAAEVLMVPSEEITVELGSTTLPKAGVAGGSQLAGNLTAVVSKAALKMREQLLQLAATTPDSPLYQSEEKTLTLADGSVRNRIRSAKSIDYSQLLELAGKQTLDVTANTFKAGTSEEERQKMVSSLGFFQGPTSNDVSAHSWSAIFVEVRVDEDFGTVRVKRMVGAFDSGRLYNPQLARSQWMGGMIMGLGQALFEEGTSDPVSGRIVNNSLADYLVAVNADVPDIVTIDVGEPDFLATAAGGKAVGEIGIVGVAAAISNAVYHATGKRVRDLPITMEKLI